ncbi:MAG: 4Fe-4S binding protein [Nitrospirae bacterium]|nr:4Fe-4S binding protein [Nitrospirota bacterium]
MSATVKNPSLIPMPTVHKKEGLRKYLRVTTVRYAVQGFFLAFLALLPFTGLFRIDLGSGRFLVDGYQVWWSDFFLILPFWLFLISGAATVYSVLGMVYCGWACVQNTLSEFVDFLVKKIFKRHKHAIGLDTLTSRPQKLPSNIGIREWAVFILLVTLISFATGIVFAGYFIPPAQIWRDFLTGEHLHQLMWVIGGISAVMLLNLFLIRHYWCNWVCPYPLWQHFFKSEGTMKVAFEDARRGECTGCNLCVQSCIVDIDPRDTKNYTRCINCGECVIACEDYSAKRGVPSLLTFHFNGIRIDDAGKRHINKLSPVLTRFVMAGSFSLVPLSLFIYGIVTYMPFHMTLSQVPGQLDQYSIRLTNKTPYPHLYRIQERGLPARTVSWESRTVNVPAGMQVVVPFTVVEGRQVLGTGVHPFSISVRSLNGKPARISQDATYFLPAS